ncbi:MAG: M48 family metallopeptidase, partial [Bacteroidota bacterium]
MTRIKYVWLTLVLIVASNCSTVPLTGRKQFTPIPPSQMIALSEDSYQQVLNENELSDNATYTAQVNRVGERITDAVERYMKQENKPELIEGYVWEFHVLKSDQKNAWCMPGGKIAFYEGIMPICENDAGVAVVMAHEIAHEVAKHGNERLSQQLGVQLGGIALSEALETKTETTQQLALLAFGVGSQVGLILPYSRL